MRTVAPCGMRVFQSAVHHRSDDENFTSGCPARGSPTGARGQPVRQDERVMIRAGRRVHLSPRPSHAQSDAVRVGLLVRRFRSTSERTAVAGGTRGCPGMGPPPSRPVSRLVGAQVAAGRRDPGCEFHPRARVGSCPGTDRGDTACLSRGSSVTAEVGPPPPGLREIAERAACPGFDRCTATRHAFYQSDPNATISDQDSCRCREREDG